MAGAYFPGVWEPWVPYPAPHDSGLVEHPLSQHLGSGGKGVRRSRSSSTTKVVCGTPVVQRPLVPALGRPRQADPESSKSGLGYKASWTQRVLSEVNNNTVGWKGGAAVKDTCFSARRPASSSRHKRWGGSQIPVPLSPGFLMQSSGLCKDCPHVHRHSRVHT